MSPNCGYMTAAEAQGRGVAARMCEHSLGEARQRGFRAMQFNFVVSSNERAVRLWQRLGFAVVGRVPQAFAHPRLGFARRAGDAPRAVSLRSPCLLSDARRAAAPVATARRDGARTG